MVERVSQNETFLNALGWISLIAFVLLIMHLQRFIFKYQIFINESENKVSRSSFILAMISYILFIFFELLAGIYGITYRFQSKLSDAVDAFSSWSWDFGLSFVYVYLLNRLYNDFKDTSYSITKYETVLMLILLALLTLLWIAFESYETVKYFHRYTPGQTFGEWDGPDYYLIGADLIISSLILIICVVKLCCQKKEQNNASIKRSVDKTVRSMDESRISEIITQASEQQSLENVRDDISDKASNIIILGIIMLVISQPVLIISCFQKGKTLTYIYDIIKLLHGFITPIILLMGFEFNQKCYKCCCNSVLSWIKQRIINRMKSKHNNPDYKLISNNS